MNLNDIPPPKIQVQKKVWIFAPGVNGEMWEEFYEKGFIGLNWNFLGDLKKYSHKDAFLQKLITNTDKGNLYSPKNDAKVNFDFANEMNLGDLIIIKKGRSELLGYGYINSDYYFDSNRENYKSCRKVEWKLKGSWITDHQIVLKTLTDITKKDNGLYYLSLFKLMGEVNTEINYKIKYTNWLNDYNKNESGAKNSYVNALEKLSKKLDFNIFETDNIDKLKNLYTDLLLKQKKDDSKYYDINAPSYGRKGFYSAALKTYVEFINQIFTKEKINRVKMKKNTLNTILFGPPGTGKTYNSINKAVNIANPSFLFTNDRIALKEEYNRFVTNNQIIFTTFHQSMSYEDFIEGIKPLSPEPNEPLKYDVQSGIFKIACARAAYLCQKIYNSTNREIELDYTFDNLYTAFVEDVKLKVNVGNYPVFKTITGKDVEIFEINSQNSIRARARDSIATHVAPLTQNNLEKLYNKFEDISEIEELKDVQHAVGVTPRITEFYAVFRGLKEFEKSFKSDIEIFENYNIDNIDDFKKIEKFSAGIYNEAIIKSGNDAEPVILIIDEINRGNISQIFGELITLIEEDKRFGNSESLEVILPYSKSNFFVPPNLYLIGTMNTADRSVEALDSALRRRFTFEEMLPIYNLPELQHTIFDFKVSQILYVINSRIERLLDKDHLIGHAYFVNTNSDILFIDSIYKNIIPLLQEYFFGDYGKIGLVLGEGFVNIVNTERGAESFANFRHYDTNDIEEKEIYEIIDYRNKPNYLLNGLTMTFKEAIKMLMNDNVKK
jgi:hypothetical protein